MSNPDFYKDIRPEELPMPDAHVMQLIQYTLDDDIEIKRLTRLISFNPALTVQLLGLVNSAFFGFRRRIETISDALVAMGMTRLKNLILCFAVKETLSKNKIPHFNTDEFWGDSIRRGVAAQQLGYLVNGPVEEAFSAGMLQDIGLLILFSMEPEKADRWPLLRANLPEQRRKMEDNLFHTTHDTVGNLLTERWHLPGSYAAAIGSHHLSFLSKRAKEFDPGDKIAMLTAIAHLADLCNAVFTCSDKAAVMTTLNKQSQRLFDLNPETIQTLLSLLPEQVKETTEAMKINAGPQTSFKKIMNQASHKLAQDNLSYQELTWKLQNTLKERDEYAARLERELTAAREIQTSLQPDLRAAQKVAAFNLPALHLSGDFYDFIETRQGQAYFCLGDVSGKGSSAALLMSKTLALFRWMCKARLPLDQMVAELNQALCETSTKGMFVTLAAGCFTPETGEISLVNMGHPPPLIAGEKHILQVQASGPPLGILPDIRIKQKSYAFKQARLYLYSDGFTEGELKTTGRALGFKGLLRWLLQSGQMDVQEQADHIKGLCQAELTQHIDDLTLMILSGRFTSSL